MRDGTAAEIVDLALKSKPELVIHDGNLPATAEALRDLFAASGKLFYRGLPVRVCHISGFYLLILSSRREPGYAIPMP